MGEVIPLDSLLRSPAAILLSYPKFDAEEAARRLGELRSLGVEALELRGRHAVSGLRVLGKGHVGVVVAGRLADGEAAVKIRRVDADRDSFDAEVENLRAANRASVGPRFIGALRNFMVMELVGGEYLADWLAGPEAVGARTRSVLRRLLDMARRLDAIGLDHGELSRADRHILVAGGEPYIVDFESASRIRRASNVTSLVQYLFVNERMRRLISTSTEVPAREDVLEAARDYRKNSDDASFARLLRACNLDR